MEDVLSVTFFLEVAQIKPVRAPTLCCAMTAMGILQGIILYLDAAYRGAAPFPWTAIRKVAESYRQ